MSQPTDNAAAAACGHRWMMLPTLDMNPPTETRECADCGRRETRQARGVDGDGATTPATEWGAERWDRSASVGLAPDAASASERRVGTIGDAMFRYPMDAAAVWRAIATGQVLTSPDGRSVRLVARPEDKDGSLWIVKEVEVNG